MSKRKEPEPALDQDALTRHASHCHVQVAASAFKPTWELMHQPQAFHQHTPCLPAGPLPPVNLPRPAASARPHVTPAAIQAFQLVRSGNDRAWEASLEARLVAAIRKWQGIIVQAPLEFDLGRRVSRDRPLGDTLPQGLRYVFAGKAAETLHGRANPFLRFIKWCRDAGEEAFPLCEPLVFRFCTEMEGGCSAPTFLHSFLTTLRFAHYILGLSNALECAARCRVAGVARLMYLSKKKKRQRPPLTVEMVVALETLTCNAEAPALDRVIAGFFVLLVFSRGRFSDGLHMQNLRSEIPASASADSLAGYVEADVARTKAAYTLERKTMFLPIVAPRNGLSGRDWFAGFAEARQASGVPTGPGLPLLPARTTSSGWATVPPKAGVAGSWLRGVLQGLGFATRDVAPLGTHSCKATALSWTAKFGLDSATRRTLGYHSSKEDRMTHVYSRDAIAAPVRELQRVLTEIREKRFKPDETRSGYFRTEQELQESDTESSCDEEDDGEDQGALEDAVEAYVQPWAEVPGAEEDRAPVARHKVSRTIHAVADEAGNRTRCGKLLNANYCTLAEAPKFMYPLCRRCYP